MIADRWIAVDWGTTNRRAFALDLGSSDPADRPIRSITDGRGVRSIAPGCFPPALRALRTKLGRHPVMLAGMVGSNRGWIEAPYVRCPVTLERLVDHLTEVPGENGWIVPGVSFADGGRFDVMRGEEVQFFGTCRAAIGGGDGLICHPGTHAKWARVEQGAITRFRTVMTGELFALLRTHSLLAPQLSSPVEIGAAFLEGVSRSLAGSALPADLFSVRAESLLGGLCDADASALASGLLIGADVRIGLADSDAGEPITVVGDPTLTRLYAAAIQQARRACSVIDGETAFVSGIRMIVEAMR